MKNFKVLQDIEDAEDSFQRHPKLVKSGGFSDYFSNEFPVSYTPIRAGMFNIYLFGQIEDASQFIPAIEVLAAATENDIVTIHLSTNGGSLDATDTFLDSMRTCDARIIIRATGGVHSAGTVILMNADEFVLSENFNCLIHNGSCGVGGKYSDFKSQAKATEKYMDSVLRKTYAGFLTEAEIDALVEGKDFWFDADEFCKRYELRNSMLQVKLEETQADLMRALGLISDAKEEDVKVKRKPRIKKSKPVTKAVTE